MTSATDALVEQARIEPVAGLDGIVTLTFPSELLGRDSTSMVWLPGEEIAEPPVLYHLHGTVGTTFPDPVERWADRRLERRLPVHPFVVRRRRPAVFPESSGFAETRPQHRFLTVAPDAGDLPWCGACNWVDGVRGQLPVERHLYEELMPVVEAVFGTRTDRGGRAIVGHSMGGGGAMIQAFRHPDRYVFAGSSSGTLTVTDDWLSRSGARWLLYSRTQGRRPIPLDRVSYRNHNLTDLAPNVRDVGIELVAVIGDGDLHLDTEDATYDGSHLWDAADEERVREQVTMEVFQRKNNDLVVPRLVEAGVDLTYITREGTHDINASTFRRHFLPRLHELFDAEPAPPPERFTYRCADDRFAIFGHEVEVVRTRPSMLQLTNARTDGTRVRLHGEGRVSVRLPLPAGTHDVRVTQPGMEPWTVTVDAEPGRPTTPVTVVLDPGRLTVGGPGRLARAGEADIADLEVCE